PARRRELLRPHPANRGRLAGCLGPRAARRGRVTVQLRFRSRQRPPEQLDGVKILYATAKSKRHKIAWYLILFAVLSPILLLLTGVVGSWLTLTANGTVALEQYEIRAPRSGRINRLGVLAGETVAAGKTIAVLDSLELDAAAARNAIERQAPAGGRGPQKGAGGAALPRGPGAPCQGGRRGTGPGLR